MSSFNNVEKIFNFLEIVNNLKKTYRFSEVEVLRNTESSADHSWRLALLTFLAADELKLNINIEHAVKIALVHDIPEAITGDIDAKLIFNKHILKKEKYINELKAIKQIRDSLSEKLGQEIFNLWIEFEKKETKEAKFVNALDKLEGLLHLIQKGQKAIQKDEKDFLGNYGNDALKEFPQLIGFFEEMKKRLKKEFLSAEIDWKKEYNGIIK